MNTLQKNQNVKFHPNRVWHKIFHIRRVFFIKPMYLILKSNQETTHNLRCDTVMTLATLQVIYFSLQYTKITTKLINQHYSCSRKYSDTFLLPVIYSSQSLTVLFVIPVEDVITFNISALFSKYSTTQARTSLRALRHHSSKQWLKSNRTQGNAISLYPIYSSGRSPTSDVLQTQETLATTSRFIVQKTNGQLIADLGAYVFCGSRRIFLNFTLLGAHQQNNHGGLKSNVQFPHIGFCISITAGEVM